MNLAFHHINVVSSDVDGLHDFYTRLLGLADVPAEHFSRTEATGGKGYSGKIRFATDGAMQMHLAEQDFGVAFKNGKTINPVERGHIAFRTDDIAAVKALLKDRGIPYSDYGTTFSQEWHQIFLQDPAGTIIEIHQQVGQEQLMPRSTPPPDGSRGSSA
ncbi:MAG: VOC family protein [Rhodobacteraceae bacterium]|nr:VOC family protein [Paracoccaceae bacterium]